MKQSIAVPIERDEDKRHGTYSLEQRTGPLSLLLLALAGFIIPLIKRRFSDGLHCFLLWVKPFNLEKILETAQRNDTD